MPRRHLLFWFLTAGTVAVGGGLAVALDETPKDIIAAHIRMQGFACENPVSAEHDRGSSKPNEEVWLLKCEKHSYRVRLVPDMAASVTPMD